MLNRYVTLILLLIPAFAAAQSEMRPADFEFEEAKRRLDQLIEFPEVKGDTSVMLHCFAQISTGGKMQHFGCYQKDNFEAQFASATVKAMRKARLNPAVIDGKRRKIYLQFRVEFIAEDEDRRIFLFLNPGVTENIEAYGLDHVAAQREIGDEPWQDICPKRANYRLWLRAYVGEDGRPENPNLEPITGILPTPVCQNAIKETILNSTFTPAMADGYPVPSTFIELFGN